MNSKMQQDIGGICPTVSANSMDRRDMNICYDERRVQVPPQHMQSNYYKFQNEIVQNQNGNIPEMPTAAHWWRESSEVFNNQQPPPQPQPAEPVSNCNTSCAAPISTVTHTSQGTSTDPPPKQKATPRAKSERHTDSDGVYRAKQPEKWKVNVKKNARLRGESYVGVGGKIVPAKVIGPACDCRMRCGEKINDEMRRELHQVFWKTCTWEQRRQYIALLVKECAKQRSRSRADAKETRRQVTFTYCLLIQGDFITVCKPMFLNTFSISEKLVRIAMDKKRSSPGGIIGPDQRGRHTPKSKKPDNVRELVRDHIKSFPADRMTNTKEHTGKRYLDASLSIAALHKLYVKKCEENGVPATDIVKESYYRRIFKTEFNLGFKTSEDKNKSGHGSGYSNKNKQ